ncbi:MAG TPA: ornithine carbamoyltransferase [Phycisphaerae bacterium]|nr:ornithine carbamoyltransferase [Phycisphaerae bacterium]HOI54088.1 ornithine carbamoyltransferase [Phycisphaerae bacterium]
MDARHLVNINDLSDADLNELFATAKELKAHLACGRAVDSLAGKTLAMIFEKPSLRTRVSFEVGMNQLGGRALYLSPAEIGLGRREATKDVARVLSGYVDGIMARTFAHETITELAAHSRVPVINGLSDYSHPCQALADMLTAMEEFGEVRGRTWVFVGDGNNVARSLCLLCARLGVTFRLAAPKGYELDEAFLAGARRDVPALRYELIPDPQEAMAGADVIYTDTWVSMGQEDEKQKRLQDFQGYCVDTALMRAARREAIVMHCLPAYRGVEITDEVLDGPQSRVLQEAENRMHAQKAVLHLLLQKGREGL